MAEVKINLVVPSKGRATTITTPYFFPETIVCVSESELPIYKEHNPNIEYVTHPDNLIGIGPKRQFIYDKFKNVFMLDDDLKGMARMMTRPNETTIVSAEECYWLIQYCGNMAKLTGSYLFGFSNWVRPEHYTEHQPFSLTGYINGAGLGMLEGASMLKFSDKIQTSQDYYLSGINAHFYRTVFIDRRFCLKQSSFANNVGGCSEFRTKEIERRDFEELKKCFGKAIQLKKPGKQNIKQEFSKVLNIPF